AAGVLDDIGEGGSRHRTPFLEVHAIVGNLGRRILVTTSSADHNLIHGKILCDRRSQGRLDGRRQNAADQIGRAGVYSQNEGSTAENLLSINKRGRDKLGRAAVACEVRGALRRPQDRGGASLAKFGLTPFTVTATPT